MNDLIKNKPKSFSVHDAIWRFPDHFSNTKHLEDEMILFYTSLFVAIGISCNMLANDCFLKHQVISEHDRDGPDGYRFVERRESLRGISPHQKNLAYSSYGVLADQLYPWNDEERLFSRIVLDPRLRFGEEGRTTQSEQVKASRTALRFGNTILHPEEIERLLSISFSSETLIPQCIHCFSLENSFGRLKDPRFQALLQGLLLSGPPSDGEEALLATSLKNPLLARALHDFLSWKKENQLLHGKTRQQIKSKGSS